ncbi:Serine-tRNA synthetase, type1 [Orpheovirus IHUMI-LCC2]|uniref:serine--tRNA ligase n=1 Tax=Orpheovirus IHUMI-LCC2 TaxID=2023057 RepID=A0A2I2L4X3_9VIRU|nr:Serine-tRNA synthetase, type1 [Orpheovirus IHUMI-LCC2]SNW62509.1 Serine-tRNA synthetase, type1 [Orpheovirus IHUMI-LCC2]
MTTSIDIKLFRNEESIKVLKESLRNRFKDETVIDYIVLLDKNIRSERYTLNEIKKTLNVIKKNYGKDREEGEDPDKLIEENISNIQDEVHRSEREIKDREEELYKAINEIGNVIHPSVPISKDERDNEEVFNYDSGIRSTLDGLDLYHHDELLKMIDGCELEKGSEVAGHRGYYLKGVGMYLNQALINYALSFLAKKGYTSVQTPYFMNKDVMSKVSQLDQYDEELYKVVVDEKKDEGDVDTDKYLIATSEQPLCALHMEETIQKAKLPIKYGGYSTCFRKEAGSHGRDAWGIFRVHQFEKVEQFCITTPDNSWNMHEEMIKISQEFYQSLGLSFRVVNIVSGELNNAAAKKYDLEAWFPTLDIYRELVSCSNCTDYQSRRLGIKCGYKDNNGNQGYVHMLNGTLCATERTLCCLLENYQRVGGIIVPEVLRPYLAMYMEKVDFIPFVKGLKTQRHNK